MPSYTFDRASGRYRGPNGRYVSPAQLHAGVVTMAERSAERMANLGARLQSGELTPAGFAAAARQEIKTTHLAASLAAHGGKNAMTKSTYGYVGSQIKAHYKYLDSWVKDLESGKAPLSGAASRAQLYSLSSLGSFEQMKARDAAASGLRYEVRNVSGGSARPCTQCPDLSAKGWVPDDRTMVLPGRRLCAMQCRCHLERRVVSVAEAA